MSPAQFEKAIAELGLNQTQAAQLLGVRDRAVRNWIAGDRAVPGTAVNFIKYLLLTGKSGEHVIKTLS
jgi:DNA-binding transcriptional regulator YiaG